jgi:phosphoserine phosphatase
MLLGDEASEHSTAYSDHVTDLPLLTWAARGIAVNPHAALAEVASDHDLQVEDWDA